MESTWSGSRGHLLKDSEPCCGSETGCEITGARNKRPKRLTQLQPYIWKEALNLPVLARLEESAHAESCTQTANS